MHHAFSKLPPTEDPDAVATVLRFSELFKLSVGY